MIKMQCRSLTRRSGLAPSQEEEAVCQDDPLYFFQVFSEALITKHT